MKKTIGLFAVILGTLLLSQSAQAAVILSDTFNSFSSDWTITKTFSLGTAGVASSDVSPAPSGNPYGYVEAAASILNTVQIERSISTIGYTNIGVEFYYKTVSANEQLIDFTQFRWKPTSSIIWNTVDINATSWTLNNMLLSSAADNTSIDIAFRVRNVLDDQTSDLLLFDDLKITGNCTGTAPCTVTPPITTNPVPEPVTMMLFGSGLAGLAVVRRKK